ncbi:uncharacterized protein FIBRA_00472 [Fibroporia radiculosa]|uniref:Cerato-platanin n=1 Tax=Fibroporia radiculosa TaxID=599839 RepID=J4H022_9APHY|nr:uncharacterized protein FIBRA_00472 [Fibroporia radiculosa]CCL98474.1 predicted protein [Fibroporia radiculosa]
MYHVVSSVLIPPKPTLLIQTAHYISSTCLLTSPTSFVKMKFITVSAAIALLAPAVLAQTSVTVAYDTAYDQGSSSLDTVSCSDGANGLITKGYTTFESLPDFPNIGAAAAVTGWNSAECGTCWELSYDGNTVTVLAIDHAGSGFNIALAAMNTLTDNQAQFLGRVTATATQVDASVCGL